MKKYILLEKLLKGYKEVASSYSINYIRTQKKLFEKTYKKKYFIHVRIL